MMLFLADTSSDFSWVSSIVQLGGVGGCLVWFMFRSEPRLRAIEAAIDRITRALMLLVVSLPQSNEATKQQAKGIIAEVDEAEKARTNK